MGLFLYRFFCQLALMLLLPFFIFYPRLRGGLRQRLGFWPRFSCRHPVWFHGSSAGDIAALVPLVEEVNEQNIPIVISCFTQSGEKMVRARLGHSIPVLRQPFDTPSVISKVLDSLKPRLLVLECLEVWPHLILGCHARNIPVVIVNGRMSKRSLSLYQTIPSVFHGCFKALGFVSTLTEKDKKRFIAAGVPAQRIVVESSSKYCALNMQHQSAAEHKLVLGSIHRKEESILLPYVGKLYQEMPHLKVVIAPRHPHRALAIMRKLNHLGVPSDFWTQQSTPPQRVVILDCMGNLCEQYGGARIAFIGGSLIPKGGHNPIEPAAKGCPVLVGPHTENCSKEVERLLESGAAEVIQSGADFWRACTRILLDEHIFARRQKACLAIAQELAGSSKRIIARLGEFLV